MANAQTPEVLNLKTLIEPPYDTDVGLLHSSIHVWKLNQTGRQVLQGKNSHNCVKTQKNAQRSTTRWSRTQNNIKIANHVVSGVFGWLRKERSGIRFSHTWQGQVWVHMCGESSGHMAFQSSVVFVAFRHCLTCPAYPTSGVFWIVVGFQVVP